MMVANSFKIFNTSTCPAWKRSNAPSMYTTRAFGPGPWIRQKQQHIYAWNE